MVGNHCIFVIFLFPVTFRVASVVQFSFSIFVESVFASFSTSNMCKDNELALTRTCLTCSAKTKSINQFSPTYKPKHNSQVSKLCIISFSYRCQFHYYSMFLIDQKIREHPRIQKLTFSLQDSTQLRCFLHGSQLIRAVFSLHRYRFNSLGFSKQITWLPEVRWSRVRIQWWKILLLRSDAVLSLFYLITLW